MEAAAEPAEAGPSNTEVVAAAPQPEPFVHTSGIIPTLQNVVSTVNFDCKLDLKQIALQARNAEYNPKVGAQRRPCSCPCLGKASLPQQAVPLGPSALPQSSSACGSPARPPSSLRLARWCAPLPVLCAGLSSTVRGLILRLCRCARGRRTRRPRA